MPLRFTMVICLLTAAALAGPARAEAGPRGSIPALHPTSFGPPGPNVPLADFDGDGYGDAAVSAAGEDYGASDSGAVYVIYGSKGGLDPFRSRIFTERDLGLAPGDGDFFGSALATGNFNGDAYSDLAIGAGFRASGSAARAGIVVVLYGTASGLGTNGATILQQGGSGSPDPDDATETDDRFGLALAAGDFGRSPEDDLAVGAPDESIGSSVSLAGAVSVFFGSASGVSASHHQFFTAGTPGVPGKPGDVDYFGNSLAAANFGHSSRADLAIGAPGMAVAGTEAAGAVEVLYGALGGLSTVHAQFLREGSNGIPGTPDVGEELGWSLAAGDFGRSARADLAIGVPFETVGGVSGAGEVIVLSGSADGLDPGTATAWDESNDGAPSPPESFDQFGFSLTAGDLGLSAQADLAVGAPFEDRFSIHDSGGVIVIYGSPAGLTPTGSQFWDQDTPGVGGSAEQDDHLGAALAGGLLGGGPGLLMGVPGEDLGSSAFDAGDVNVLYGGSNGLSASGDQLLVEGHHGLPGTASGGDEFGIRLAA